MESNLQYRAQRHGHDDWNQWKLTNKIEINDADTTTKINGTTLIRWKDK